MFVAFVIGLLTLAPDTRVKKPKKDQDKEKKKDPKKGHDKTKKKEHKPKHKTKKTKPSNAKQKYTQGQAPHMLPLSYG